MSLYTELNFNDHSSYLIPNILDFIESNRKRWTSLTYHNKFQVRKADILTPAGLEFFKDYRTADIFRVPPHHTSGIHVDRSFTAFNFIIKGAGIMQWFNIDDLETKHISEYGTQVYSLLPGKSPIAETGHNTLIVDTRAPHRIVNSLDQERLCVSLRRV
jgi:hypothetical protein